MKALYIDALDYSIEDMLDAKFDEVDIRDSDDLVSAEDITDLCKDYDFVILPEDLKEKDDHIGIYAAHQMETDHLVYGWVRRDYSTNMSHFINVVQMHDVRSYVQLPDDEIYGRFLMRSSLEILI